MIVLRGLPSHKSTHGRSQEIGFEATLKRKIELITWSLCFC